MVVSKKKRNVVLRSNKKKLSKAMKKGLTKSRKGMTKKVVMRGGGD